MSFVQRDLPYGFDDLAPHLDRSVLEIHFTKHHAGYVAKLNAALEHSDLINKSLESLVADLSVVAEGQRAAVKKLAGQHYNHQLYWESLSPRGGGEPVGALADAIVRDFGSYDEFRKQFSAASAAQFGSGWAWLSDNNGKLEVSSTGNEDTPLMTGAKPLLTLDVWEHAYYLQYQNRRPDFIEAFWNVVDWNAINERFTS
jgi:superoxide dismutase, Fe-Mn family